MDFNLQFLVISAASLVMLIGVSGVFYDRIKYEKGIGLRVIQFLAVILIIPTILILAIKNVLNSETIATLLGAMIGYVLSGIGKDEKSNK